MKQTLLRRDVYSTSLVRRRLVTTSLLLCRHCCSQLLRLSVIEVFDCRGQIAWQDMPWRRTGTIGNGSSWIGRQQRRLSRKYRREEVRYHRVISPAAQGRSCRYLTVVTMLYGCPDAPGQILGVAATQTLYGTPDVCAILLHGDLYADHSKPVRSLLPADPGTNAKFW